MRLLVRAEGYSDKSKDGWPDVEARTGPGNTWFRNHVASMVGNQQGQTRAQNVLANLVAGSVQDVNTHYVGANRVAGMEVWGEVAEGAQIPASLYLRTRPSFFADAEPWPMFGPGVEGWGAANTLPAAHRSANLIDNGGFESAGAWTTGPVFSWSEAGRHGRGLRLVGAAAWANAQQTFAVRPGKIYTWSFWGKSSSTGARFKVLTPTSAVVKECGSSHPSAEWTQYFCNFASGANERVKIYIGDGGGEHVFDDMVVYH